MVGENPNAPAAIAIFNAVSQALAATSWPTFNVYYFIKGVF
jgi:hypothetical protein